jgi:hypothetical protein
MLLAKARTLVQLARVSASKYYAFTKCGWLVRVYGKPIRKPHNAAFRKFLFGGNPHDAISHVISPRNLFTAISIASSAA